MLEISQCNISLAYTYSTRIYDAVVMWVLEPLVITICMHISIYNVLWCDASSTNYIYIYLFPKLRKYLSICGSHWSWKILIFSRS